MSVSLCYYTDMTLSFLLTPLPLHSVSPHLDRRVTDYIQRQIIHRGHARFPISPILFNIHWTSTNKIVVN